MLNPARLAPHPRLYIGQEEIRRLRTPPKIACLRQAAAILDKDARSFVESAVFTWERNTHNAHLLRARTQQIRVTSLLLQWLRTDDARYREAAVAHLREMAAWECWSWISWRKGDMAPDSIFDLSYGENATTLALAWDLLHPTLSADERDLLLGLARKWAIPAFLRHTEPGKEMWWVSHHDCNWLAVCAGGAGMLALAMFEEFPEAQLMLERADAGVSNFMVTLKAAGGGWSEGPVYWNYGMRYAFTYLLSHEHAVRTPHPVFAIPEVRETLRFPLDFAPYGRTCAFGDIGDAPWQPVAVHYAAAARLGADDVLWRLDALPHDRLDGAWPTAPELLALHPRLESPPPDPQAATSPVIKLYPGLAWGVLADRLPESKLYLSVRGGTTTGPHNSADLLSYYCVVDAEPLISSLTNREYIDTTFSERRFELSEVRADTKNTILIGGVGIAHPAYSESSVVTTDGRHGIRIDATQGYRISFDGPSVLFAGRLFLWLADRHVLIVDRVELAHANRIETRLHSYARLEAQPAGALITGDKAALRVAFAASVPCRVATSLTTPTNPADPQASVLRWATVGLEASATLATLLAPGDAAASLLLSESGSRLTVRVSSAGGDFSVQLSSKLT